jgi:hypothetical protein
MRALAPIAVIQEHSTLRRAPAHIQVAGLAKVDVFCKIKSRSTIRCGRVQPPIVGFDGAQQLSCGNKTNAPGIPVAEFLKNL